MARTSLPPGFRFHPTDVELIMYYLLRKVTGKKLHLEAISELNLYQFSPWDLPDKSCLKAKDLEWYFFCPRERKYASGARMNRATETGYWKTTGKDRTISYNDRVVGMVKTLVFHEGNSPHGKRTDWVLHEYRLEDKRLADAVVVQDTFVLCKVFQKSGPGPRNGAQYGAPFKEEEWDDDDFDTSTLPSDSISPLVHTLPEAQNFSVATNMAAPGSDCRPLLVEPAESKIQSSSNNGLPNAQNYSVAMNMVDPGSATGWSLTDDDFDTSTLPSDAMSQLVHTLSEAQNCSVATSMAAPGSSCRPLLVEPAESKFQSSSNNGLPNAQNYSVAMNMVDPGSASGWSLTDVAPGNISPYVNDQSTDEADDIARLLSAFSEEDALLTFENCNIQKLGDLNGGGNNEAASHLAGSGSFDGLQDVCNLSCIVDAPASQYCLNQSNLLGHIDMPFLELDDLGASLAFSGPGPSSGGLYEAFTPIGPEQSVFPGLSNSDSTCNQIGQSFCNGFFGPQPNFPVLSELPMLSNSSDGLLDSLVFPQTAMGYGNNLPQGGSSTNNFYPTSDSQPGNVRGAGAWRDSG